MYLLTCSTKGCPTPHFYVDPDGGKIVLVAAPDAPELQIKMLEIGVSQSSPEVILDKISNAPDGLFTEEDVAFLKKSFEKLKQPQSWINPATPLDNVKDYLVVHCESNHTNYVLVEKSNEIGSGSHERDSKIKTN